MREHARAGYWKLCLARATLLSVMAVTGGCEGGGAAATRTPDAAPPAKTPGVPDDISYSVKVTTAKPGIKRSLDIFLNKKVTEQELQAIARDLKSQDQTPYARTFMTYYLSGMTAGAGAWATTHFDPDLNVEILGLSKEEEEKIALDSADVRRSVIGQWLDESPYIANRTTIFQEGKNLYLEQRFKDGSSRRKELLERRSPRGRRFELKDGSRTGDYWIITSDGNLQMGDNEGLIATAPKSR